MADLTDVDSHFDFGRNWLSYLEHVDDEAIASAEQGLTKLVPAERLRGSRFLDIGCGSGLHSLAALRLGVAQLMAVDIDAKSVSATRRLLAQSPSEQVDVQQLSVFDLDPVTLGTFDVVYSWGVLHHTGAMWAAVEKAAALVRPGGILAIALYRRTFACPAWRIEKRVYTRSPKTVRAAIRAAYTALSIASLPLSGTNPISHIRNYKSKRGMNYFNDIDDWLGGYPYESASPAEVVTKLRQLGFEPFLDHPSRPPKGWGIFGTGCAEYSFAKVA